MSNFPKWRLPFGGVTGGLTATGSVQGDALPLTIELNVIANVSSGTGVILPALATNRMGMELLVVNNGANNLNIYPTSGQQIDSQSANAPYVLIPGASIVFKGISATVWYSFQYYDILNSTTVTTFDTANDFLAMYQASSGKRVKISAINLPINISGLTAGTAINIAADDYLVFYDFSAASNRKILANEILNKRSVLTSSSLAGGGNLGADLTLTLVNDSASPGNSYYYGSDSSGVKGWFPSPVVVGENYCINGAMQVWQRAVTFPSTAVGDVQYTADRWGYLNAGTGKTISRQLSGLDGVQYCVRVQRDNGTSATTGVILLQPLETSTSIPFEGQTATLSFMARKGANFSGASDLLNSIIDTGTGTDQSSVNQANGAWTGQTVNNQNNTLTTSWQLFSYSVAIGSGVTQLGMRFQYTPVGTAGAADYFEITKVKLEIGVAATRFDFDTYQQVFEQCQRFLPAFKSSGGASEILGSTYSISTTAAIAVMPFFVPARIKPTGMTISAVGHVSVAAGGVILTVTNTVFDNSSSIYCGSLDLTTSGTANGQGGAIVMNNASGLILFTGCEL